MPIPIQTARATLVVNGVSYELRNVHVMAEHQHTVEAILQTPSPPPPKSRYERLLETDDLV